MNSTMSSSEVVFGIVRGKNVVSQIEWFVFIILVPCWNDIIIIGVPGKVVYLHYTTVNCTYLSVVLVPFRSC